LIVELDDKRFRFDDVVQNGCFLLPVGSSLKPFFFVTDRVTRRLGKNIHPIFFEKIAQTVAKTKMTNFLHQSHSESQKHVYLTTRTTNYKYLGKNVKKCQSEKEHENLATYGVTYSTKKFPWVFKSSPNGEILPNLVTLLTNSLHSLLG